MTYILEQINSVLSGIAVPLLLVTIGLFYGFKLKFFHILKPRLVIGGMRSEKRSGGISSGKAVCLALAGTLGVGNIVGVSSAIYLGGFGAVFWMWVSALVAMILKYAEIVLAMRYRKWDSEGRPYGAAMLYIKAFFESHRLKKIGNAVAAVFAVSFLLNALTMGSMLQANAISDAVSGVFGISPLLVGGILCLLTFIMLRRGSGGMASLTEILVPVMSIGYIVMSIAVIIGNAGDVADAFNLIFSSAFTPSSAVGGIGGYIFTSSVRYGVMRGLVSNEAGCGTAPTAHAIADCKLPAKQGMWGIFEVFADTIVLCTMTALCVILNYDAALEYGGNYMMMTVAAYARSLGNFAAVFISISVVCFGFATIVCWAHYGTVSAKYFGDKKWIGALFSAVYCGCVAVGCVVSADTAWQLADLAMGVMTVINLCVITGMWKEVKEESDLFFSSLSFRGSFRENKIGHKKSNKNKSYGA